MPEKPLKIVYLSPGAAGMYCGSCMNDNMLARTLIEMGHDVVLLPLYTPLLTDEQDVSDKHIFFGGINVYLQEKIPLFRHVPRFLDRVLDSPWLLRGVARGSIKTDPAELGSLTLSIVRGEHGHQRKEVSRLVDWLARHERPSLVVLSNLMIAGSVPAIKRRLNVPVLLTLQGDDVFLDGLSEPYRSQVMQELRELAKQVDGVITHSHFYADAMADYFEIPRDKFHVVPLGISVSDSSPIEPVEVPDGPAPCRPPTVGYFARICPAKGLHILVEAMQRLRQMPDTEDARLHVAGWLGESDKKYLEQLQAKIGEAGDEGHTTFQFAVDASAKRSFYESIDVLSVPTVYREPKGRYVLEAMASGVPVVQPDHGAFPELLKDTGGGRLVPPENPQRLAEVLHELLTQPAERRRLGEAGREAVLQRHSDSAAARAVLDVFSQYVS